MKQITVDARMINASGIGTVIKNILKRLIQEKNDWHFNIIGKLKELNQFEFTRCANVTLIECNAPIYSIKEQIALMRIIPKETDVFWAPHYNIPLLYFGKLVVTVHDVFHLAMPQFVGGIHKRAYAKFMFEMVKRKADHIITVSEFTASELEKYVGIPKERISVIYNGIDEEWFNIRQGKKVHNKPYILYVGNVKPHKNLITLVKAFLQVKDQVDYDLIIVGKKDGFITGDEEICKLVIQEPQRIIFTGYVEDDLLKQYYKQASIFVFPSLYEGFGLPPLEALAAGCPRVLCSNAASLPEICGNMVEYFEAKDTISLKNLLLRNNMAAKQEKIFLWRKTVEKYIKIIEKLK